MKKLRLKIDSDIDFRLLVTVEAFGLEAIAGIRRKSRSGQALPKPAPEIVDPVSEVWPEHVSGESQEQDE